MDPSLTHRRAPWLGLLGPLTPVRDGGSGETVRSMGTPAAMPGPDTVAWLLDCDDPSVRYFTLILLGESADGVAAAKTRCRIMTEGAVPGGARARRSSVPRQRSACQSCVLRSLAQDGNLDVSYRAGHGLPVPRRLSCLTTAPATALALPGFCPVISRPSSTT